MKNDFEKLVQNFCQLCGIADSASVAKGAAVNVDDVVFSIVYNEESAPDRVQLFCDYGTVPKGQEEASYRALLEANLVAYDSDTAVFSLSPETRHVICASRFALQSFGAEELRGVMAFFSQKAKEWRKDHSGPVKSANTASSFNSKFAIDNAATGRTKASGTDSA